MSWLNGASDLGAVVKGLYGGGSAIQKQDWGSLGANLTTVAGKAAIYASKQNAVLAKALKESGTKMLPTPTAIVDAASIAILVVDFLNGFGTPNAGAAVSSAAKSLDLFMKGLDPGSIPDARDWSGTAATAYSDQVATLKRYAQQMKDLDASLQTCLKSQAGKVNEAHLCIAVNSGVLTAAQGIALALYLIPIVGPEVSLAWQIVAAFACCMAVFALEIMTLANSMSLSHDVTALGHQYLQLGQEVEAKLAGTFGKIEGEVATEASSQLSNFKDISGGLSTFAAAPTVSSLAAKAGDSASPAQRVLLEAAGDSLPQSEPASAAPASEGAVEAAPQPGPPAAAPAFTLPTMARVNSGSAQAAKVAGNLSEPMNLANQTMGSVQSIAQTGQQGLGAAAAEDATVAEVAPEEAARAGDVGGAASGAEGAGHAPVDVEGIGARPAGAGRERVL